MFTARIVWENGKVEERELSAGNDGVVTLRRDSLPRTGIRQVELRSKTFTARAGEEGFFLIPSVENDGASALTLFREREDTESAFRLNIMPVFAVSTASGAVLEVVEGMPFEYELVAGVRGGRYYLFPRFLFAGEDASRVRITVGGEEYGTYSLSEDQTIEINDTNICEIKDGEVNMTRADCPDQLCIHQGPIHIQGETIVCLPNRVVVEITGNDAEEQLDGIVQ